MYICRREDDGWLTRIVSYTGWFLVMGSRVLIFCLIVYHVHYWLILFCVVHVLLFSIWIFNIAIESYAVSSSSAETTTVRFNSLRKRSSLALLVVFFFGIPSLVYWPIMFQLKVHFIIFRDSDLILFLFFFF